jgi:hypothetical protein
MAKKRQEHKAEVEAKILNLTKGRFMTLAEIAEAMRMSRNTVRAKYLYPMANDGRLERQYPRRTNAQAYKAA